MFEENKTVVVENSVYNPCQVLWGSGFQSVVWYDWWYAERRMYVCMYATFGGD